MDERLWQFSLHATQALLWLALLAIVWFWGRRTSLSRLLLLLIFFTFDLVLIGAYVRIADAGLGCPDWPGCFGQFSPTQARTQIDAAIAAQGHADWGPVNHAKAWKEMLHRYWASAVGVLILLALWRAWWERGPDGARIAPDAVRTGMAWALAVVLLQGLFGKWTVTWKLMPMVVTLHLLGAMWLLAVLVTTQARASMQAAPLTTPKVLPLPAALRPGLTLAMIMLLVQIALGGWTSSNYAGLACTGYPGCAGQGWPEALSQNAWEAFREAFTPLRALGYQADGALLAWPALVAIAWTHRWFALVVIAALAWVAWRLRTHAPGLAWGIIALVLVQWALGVANVLLQLPVLLAVAHNGVATLLFVLLVHARARATAKTVSSA